MQVSLPRPTLRRLRRRRPSCPCSAWSASTTPTTPQESDSNAVELGVKFTTSIDGFITGVRFYKGTDNTGTHVGNLWSAGGALLARATFSAETASGWQQVNFASPVPVNANTVYVASYYAPNGRYAADLNFFATSGVSNGPVNLLSSGAAGGNGVYNYSSRTTFPSSTFNATNYWVDIVFSDTGTAPPPAAACAGPSACTCTCTCARTRYCVAGVGRTVGNCHWLPCLLGNGTPDLQPTVRHGRLCDENKLHHAGSSDRAHLLFRRHRRRFGWQ